MAETTPDTSAKKPKRRLKAAPTLREQAASSAAKSNKPTKSSKVRRFFGSKIFAPFRAFGRLLAAIWGSSIFRPIRFIVRIIGRILVPKYFRNSWKELGNVTWPDFKTTWRLTFAVIVFGVAFGLAIYGTDIVLEKAFREVLLGR